VFLANSRFNNCVDDIKAHGYIEIENVGSVGIALYAADAKGLKILKVYDNSPAAKAGIVKGDIVNNVNGKVITHRGDFDVVNGVIGTHVEITINRDGVVKTYDLVRAKLAYSRVFEDVVYD
jgi:carboxyl-terminal processing protease